MKKKFVLLAALIISITSCEKDNNTPEPEKPEPKVFTYTYTGKHEIKDFNVYTGPHGEKVDMPNEKTRNFWGKNSMLEKVGYPTIIINKEKSKLYLIDEFSKLDFPLRISNDTLYFNDTEYLGVFTTDTSFMHNRAFYFIHHKGKYNEESGLWWGGHQGEWHAYEKASINEFLHENASFKSLKDMTLESDTIAWLTEYYEYKLTESE